MLARWEARWREPSDSSLLRTTGLLQPTFRTQSGYRIYRRDAVKRLKFIKRPQELGFSMSKIKEHLDSIPGYRAYAANRLKTWLCSSNAA
ncbi:MerR family transcriptional regulator [Acidobacterium sp.]|uniref:MerR family transcriptional regulator n=1 Tax=Acidobacterium sp. TaxID=1872119 RepID=UPI00338F1323